MANILDGISNALLVSVHEIRQVGTPRLSIVNFTVNGALHSRTVGYKVHADGMVPLTNDAPQNHAVPDSEDAATLLDIERALGKVSDKTQIDKTAILRVKQDANIGPRAACWPGLQISGMDVGLPMGSLQSYVKAVLNCAKNTLSGMEGVTARVEGMVLVVVGESALPAISVAEGTESDAWLEVWSLPAGWTLDAL